MDPQSPHVRLQRPAAAQQMRDALVAQHWRENGASAQRALLPMARATQVEEKTAGREIDGMQIPVSAVQRPFPWGDQVHATIAGTRAHQSIGDALHILTYESAMVL
jgi:hypothetical protein